MLMELISFLRWMYLFVSFIKLLLSIHSLIDRLVFPNTSNMPRSDLIFVIFATVVSLMLSFLLMQVCHTAVFEIEILLWILILNFMLWMFTMVLFISNLWQLFNRFGWSLFQSTTIIISKLAIEFIWFAIAIIEKCLFFIFRFFTLFVFMGWLRINFGKFCSCLLNFTFIFLPCCLKCFFEWVNIFKFLLS